MEMKYFVIKFWGFFQGIPSAVQLYRMNNSYWETFNSTTSRTFVCEQGLRIVALYWVLHIFNFNTFFRSYNTDIDVLIKSFYHRYFDFNFVFFFLEYLSSNND